MSIQRYIALTLESSLNDGTFFSTTGLSVRDISPDSLSDAMLGLSACC